MSLQRINNRGDSRATPASGGELFPTAFLASLRGSRSSITSHLNLHRLINTRHERHLTRCELSATEALSSAVCGTRKHGESPLETTVSGEPRGAVPLETAPGPTMDKVLRSSHGWETLLPEVNQKGFETERARKNIFKSDKFTRQGMGG